MKKLTSILCLVIGLVILLLGITAKAQPADNGISGGGYSYYPEDYYLRSASFGADFYTYIYEGSDVIVDELNDINQAMATVVEAENGIYRAAARNISATDELTDTVNRYGSLLLIAIGLAVIAYGLVSTGKAFAKSAPVLVAEGPAVAEPAVPAAPECVPEVPSAEEAAVSATEEQ